MRRLTLTEFQTEQAVRLSLDERDALRRLYRGIRVEPSEGREGHFDITPDEHISIVCTPTLIFEIKPKIPISSVVFMISYACELSSWFDAEPEFAGSADLVEVVAMILARLVQNATRKGLLNGYRCEDEPLPVLRGRLLIDEQIRRHTGVTPPIEVRHDLFTADVLENRLLLAALTAVARIPMRHPQTGREIERSRRLFGNVQNSYFAPTAVPDVLITRLNSHYRSPLSLSTLILRSMALDLGAGGARGSAFLVNMNSVFESFVTTGLREALAMRNLALTDQVPLLKLDEAANIQVRPDLCVLQEARLLWVGDAKYKRLSTPGYSSADLYQMLAYTIAANLPEGTLIYAADSCITATEHVIVNAGKRLRVSALDLSAPPSSMLIQLTRIADLVHHAVQRAHVGQTSVV